MSRRYVIKNIRHLFFSRMHNAEYSKYRMSLPFKNYRVLLHVGQIIARRCLRKLCARGSRCRLNSYRPITFGGTRVNVFESRCAISCIVPPGGFQQEGVTAYVTDKYGHTESTGITGAIYVIIKSI